MKAAIVLSHTVYNLYWNRNLQFRTPNQDVVRIFLLRAAERGENLTAYHINSNVAAGYDVKKFVCGEELPMCWQVN